MNATTPIAATIADAYDDGEDARHFTLAPADGEALGGAVAPGQFFMLSVPGHGEAAFTYVSPPDARGRFTALIRRVGTLTSALFALTPGAVVGVRGPFGQGWPLAELDGQRVLIVAGGCGLAPLSPAIDRLAERAAGSVALLYGSRTAASQVLSAERARWQGQLPILETFDFPDADGQVRGTPLVRLAEGLDALGGEADAALVCGPELMMRRTASALRDAGLGAEAIWLGLERRMHCGVGLCGHCYLGTSLVCRQGPTYRLDTLQRLEAEASPRPPGQGQIHHC